MGKSKEINNPRLPLYLKPKRIRSERPVEDRSKIKFLSQFITVLCLFVLVSSALSVLTKK
tara:strand:+ start:27 stop:206 length:180 start_codon:yes stop_codon:yes gene_type:complete